MIYFIKLSFVNDMKNRNEKNKKNKKKSTSLKGVIRKTILIFHWFCKLTNDL